MDQQHFEIELRPAPDDAPVNDPRFQKELREFSKSLHTAGVTFSQRGMAFDSVDAHGYPLPEFWLALSQAIGPTLGVILLAWLQGRPGRKVRLKVGDIEAEAGTSEEVETLLLRAEEFQQRAASKSAPPPVPKSLSIESAAMPALKERAHITVAEGLTLLESRLPTEEAKTRLRQALVQGVLRESPRFAFEYDEADIDWRTGSVKLPRKKEPFFPVFLRSDFGRYFFEDHVVQPSASYSRQTVTCAADMLKALGHFGFDRFLMELNLPDQSVGRGSGLMARATSLAQYAIDNPQQPTPERRTVSYEIIRRAAQLWREGVTSNLGAGEREKFLSAMQREGQAHMLSDEQDNLALWRPETGNSGAAPSEPAPDKLPGAVMPSPVPSRSLPRRVFIVHGHEGELREAVAGFLRKIDFTPVILHEQSNQGRTIVEKFEAHAEVDFAVVLLTPDDVGGPKGGAQQPRARQNVILELGYFIGKLGRKNVCAIKLGDLEIPSDIIGVVWTPFDAHGAWKTALAKELKDAGHAINWDKVMGP